MDTRQILILVGLAVYYFVRSRGKKSNEQQKSAPNRPQARRTAAKPQRSIEDILRDLAQEDNPSSTEIKSHPTKILKEEVVTPVVEATENRPRRPHREHKKHTPIEVEELDESADFDLREAVIYEAILNPPYQQVGPL